MTKQDKLDKLDELLLDRMIDIMDGKRDTKELSDLATVSNYLAKNNVVAEKKKSSTEEYIKNRVEEAKKRREGNK